MKEIATRFFLPTAVVGGVLALAGAALVFAWEADASLLPIPTTVRISTVAADDYAGKVLAALNEQIGSEGARIRMSAIESPSIWTSAQALKDQTADVAMVRSDDPAAADGRSIVILRSISLAVMVPAGSSIDSVARLKGKKIGILTTDVDPMAKVVFDFYGFADKQIVRLDLKSLPAALQYNQVAAVAVVGPTGAGPIADVIAAFRNATKRPPKFVDIPETKSLADRFVVYHEAEISAGAFGSSPALLPAENVGTLSTNVLLVSRAFLSSTTAGELTRLLLAAKTKLVATMPEAGQLAAPSTDKDALLPAHPGTAAFLNGEQTDLLDKSMNLILLSSMLTGFVGWVGTALNRVRNKNKGQAIKRRLSRLPVLVARASNCEELAAAEKERSELSEWLLHKFLAHEISALDFDEAEARLAHLGALIGKRRRSLSLHEIEHLFNQWQSAAAPARAG